MKYLYLLVIFPFLTLDCLLNILIGGSFKHTLSATAWTVKDHKYYKWTHLIIDAIFFFQPSHCENQFIEEQAFGGVWKAYIASWKKS